MDVPRETREALAHASGADVSRETADRLDAYVELLREENERQNLVSAASLASVWTRHILDSAQLLRYAPARAETWIDLGTGAGFPGLIVAVLFPGRVTLLEGRRLRADFLERAADHLGVGARTRILCANAEVVQAEAHDVISARAFAPLDKLLRIGGRFSSSGTCWVLPKGRNAKSELDAARASWQGDFRLEPSLTDADAQIIVASGVSRRGERAR